MKTSTQRLGIIGLCIMVILSICHPVFTVHAENGETMDDYTWSVIPTEENQAVLADKSVSKDVLADQKTYSDGVYAVTVDNLAKFIIFNGTEYYGATSYDEKTKTANLVKSTKLNEVMSQVTVSGMMIFSTEMFGDLDMKDTKAVKKALDKWVVLSLNYEDKPQYKSGIDELSKHYIAMSDGTGDNDNTEEPTTEEFLTVTGISAEYTYGDSEIITGATISVSTNKEITNIWVSNKLSEDAEYNVSGKTATIKVNFTEDCTVPITITSGELESVNTYYDFTDVTKHNRQQNSNGGGDEQPSDDDTDSDNPEDNAVDISLSVTGIPNEGTVEAGKEVELTLNSNVAAQLSANGVDSDSEVTSLKFGVTSNGWYNVSATLASGQTASDSVYVGCFNEVQKASAKDPWGVDTSDEPLAQTGLYDSNIGSLVGLWVAIVAVIAVVLFVLYKKGIIKGGKRDE